MASTFTIHLAAVFCGVVLFFTCASPEIGLREGGMIDVRCKRRYIVAAILLALSLVALIVGLSLNVSQSSAG
jgi:hypothetical protein